MGKKAFGCIALSLAIGGSLLYAWQQMPPVTSTDTSDNQSSESTADAKDSTETAAENSVTPPVGAALDDPVPPVSDIERQKDSSGPMPNGNATDTQTNTVAALVTGPRLTWSPEPVVDGNRVYDLCNDYDAIESGMDGGDLDNDRERMGISCNSEVNTNRYGKTGANGLFELSDEPTPGDTDSEEQASAQLGGASSGVLLGYRGPAFDAARIPDGQLGDIVVLPDSVYTHNGITYGLISNTSNNLATDVRIETNGVSADYPLSIQSGETVAFALPTTEREVNHQDIEVQSALTDDIDISRAIMVTGTPGLWSGPQSQIPSSIGVTSNSTDVLEEVVYYESQLILKMPDANAQTSIDANNLVIDDVKVVVSFFDENDRVIGVVNQQTVRISDSREAVPSTRISALEPLTVGFLLPATAVNFAIWAGGTAQL